MTCLVRPANVTSTSPSFIANFQRFRELSEGQR
jgi:hypothetical protein